MDPGWAGEEGEGGTHRESDMEAYTLPCVKETTSGDLLWDSRSPHGGSLTARRVGRGGKRDGASGRKGHVRAHGCLMLMNGRGQQYCEAIILQLKINKF